MPVDSSRPITLAAGPLVFRACSDRNLAAEPLISTHIRSTCSCETCDIAQVTVIEPQFGHFKLFVWTLANDHCRLQ